MEKVIEQIQKNQISAFEQTKMLSGAIESLTNSVVILTGALKNAQARIAALENPSNGEGEEWKRN